jgi:hypothetical protein
MGLWMSRTFGGVVREQEGQLGLNSLETTLR